MKLSARNVLKAKIKGITEGPVNNKISIELQGGIEIVAVITKQSSSSLGLAVGKEAYAVIKVESLIAPYSLAPSQAPTYTNSRGDHEAERS